MGTVSVLCPGCTSMSYVVRTSKFGHNGTSTCRKGLNITLYSSEFKMFRNCLTSTCSGSPPTLHLHAFFGLPAQHSAHCWLRGLSVRGSVRTRSILWYSSDHVLRASSASNAFGGLLTSTHSSFPIFHLVGTHYYLKRRKLLMLKTAEGQNRPSSLPRCPSTWLLTLSWCSDLCLRLVHFFLPIFYLHSHMRIWFLRCTF